MITKLLFAMEAQHHPFNTTNLITDLKSYHLDILEIYEDQAREGDSHEKQILAAASQLS